MRYARLAVEILLRLLLWATRLAFLAAGLATLGPALLLSSSFMGDGTSAWLVALARPTLAMGVVFLAAAVLLFVIPWLLRGVPRAAPEAAAAPGPAAPAAGGGWQWLAGPVMLGLAGGAVLVSGRLLRLWGEIAVYLERAGVWREVQHGGELSGLIFAPLLFVLAAPLLGAAAAVFLGAVPLLLVALFAARSPHFRPGYAMTVVCQVALVAGSLLAAEAFAGLVQEAASFPDSQADPEAGRLIADLERMRDVVRATGRDHAWLAAGYALLLPLVLVSRPGAKAPAPGGEAPGSAAPAP